MGAEASTRLANAEMQNLKENVKQVSSETENVNRELREQLDLITRIKTEMATMTQGSMIDMMGKAPTRSNVEQALQARLVSGLESQMHQAIEAFGLWVNSGQLEPDGMENILGYMNMYQGVLNNPMDAAYVTKMANYTQNFRQMFNMDFEHDNEINSSILHISNVAREMDIWGGVAPQLKELKSANAKLNKLQELKNTRDLIEKQKLELAEAEKHKAELAQLASQLEEVNRLRSDEDEEIRNLNKLVDKLSKAPKRGKGSKPSAVAKNIANGTLTLDNSLSGAMVVHDTDDFVGFDEFVGFDDVGGFGLDIDTFENKPLVKVPKPRKPTTEELVADLSKEETIRMLGYIRGKDGTPVYEADALNTMDITPLKAILKSNYKEIQSTIDKDYVRSIEQQALALTAEARTSRVPKPVGQIQYSEGIGPKPYVWKPGDGIDKFEKLNYRFVDDEYMNAVVKPFFVEKGNPIVGRVHQTHLDEFMSHYEREYGAYKESQKPFERKARILGTMMNDEDKRFMVTKLRREGIVDAKGREYHNRSTASSVRDAFLSMVGRHELDRRYAESYYNPSTLLPEYSHAGKMLGREIVDLDGELVSRPYEYLIEKQSASSLKSRRAIEKAGNASYSKAESDRLKAELDRLNAEEAEALSHKKELATKLKKKQADAKRRAEAVADYHKKSQSRDLLNKRITDSEAFEYIDEIIPWDRRKLMSGEQIAKELNSQQARTYIKDLKTKQSKEASWNELKSRKEYQYLDRYSGTYSDRRSIEKLFNTKEYASHMRQWQNHEASDESYLALPLESDAERGKIRAKAWDKEIADKLKATAAREKLHAEASAKRHNDMASKNREYAEREAREVRSREARAKEMADKNLARDHDMRKSADTEAFTSDTYAEKAYAKSQAREKEKAKLRRESDEKARRYAEMRDTVKRAYGSDFVDNEDVIRDYYSKIERARSSLRRDASVETARRFARSEMSAVDKFTSFFTDSNHAGRSFIKSLHYLSSSIVNSTQIIQRAFQSLERLMRTSDTYTSTNNMVKFMNTRVDTNLGDEALIDTLFEAADFNRMKYNDLAASYAKFGMTGAFDSNEELLNFVSGLNATARLSGATQGEVHGMNLQMSQALSLGHAQMQELNSILEANKLLRPYIAKAAGIEEGQIKDTASARGITADVLKKAVQLASEDGVIDSYQKMDYLFSDYTSRAQNSFGRFLTQDDRGVLLMDELKDKFSEIVNFLDSDKAKDLMYQLGQVGMQLIDVFGEVVKMAIPVLDFMTHHPKLLATLITTMVALNATIAITNTLIPLVKGAKTFGSFVGDILKGYGLFKGGQALSWAPKLGNRPDSSVPTWVNPMSDKGPGTAVGKYRGRTLIEGVGDDIIDFDEIMRSNRNYSISRMLGNAMLAVTSVTNANAVMDRVNSNTNAQLYGTSYDSLREIGYSEETAKQLVDLYNDKAYKEASIGYFDTGKFTSIAPVSRNFSEFNQTKIKNADERASKLDEIVNIEKEIKKLRNIDGDNYTLKRLEAIEKNTRDTAENTKQSDFVKSLQLEMRKAGQIASASALAPITININGANKTNEEIGTVISNILRKERMITSAV